MVVGGDDFLLQLREFAENPAVQAGQLVVGHGMFRRIEVVKVRELVAQRVADAAVGLADLVDAFLAHDDVVAVILRGDPEPHDVRAVFFDVGFGGLRFFVAALACLLLEIFSRSASTMKPCVKHGLERRRAVAREREQQRGLKPAAMLVAAFEINVGLPAMGCRVASSAVT